MNKPVRILFVCLGNIVRSPLAENLFRFHAGSIEQKNNFVVDSAGTAAYHIGVPPDERMRRTALQHGLKYTGSGRQVTQEDLESFDLILAMDKSNYDDLRRLAQSDEQNAKIRLFRDFDPQAGGSEDVPDPYYDGPEGFERTYQIVERGVRGILEEFSKGNL
ncbi:MAG: low molecular weight phosphotyrosine protein phosphatase [Chloroflexi bacterium]|nr:low molecular weight phosphotyrosine protein phosphatase [Chloroflexota bacterium]